MTANIFEPDDTKLVEKFVQGSNQLLASANLRLEVNGGVSQLMARNGDSIAILYLQNKPRTAIVKHNSRFLELIDRLLIDRSFVLFGDASRPGFVEYKYFVTPAGYRMSYTDPSILWKKWWPTEKFQDKQRFNMDILVSFKNNWYPIQNINVNSGNYTIKTIAGQIFFKRDDKVLWLAQHAQREQALDSQTIQPEPPRATLDAGLKSPTSSADLARKIQQKQSQVDPDRIRAIVQELEQKLKFQIQLNQEIEAKVDELEQRANIAEQRLQVVYKLLAEKGIDREAIYRQ
jgi:hypothetical protein